jgi:hypothetical protein
MKLFKAEAGSAAGVSKQLALPNREAEASTAVCHFL